jgi:cystathionine gamma-synthase
MDGFGAVLAFEVAGGAEHADRVCDRVEVLAHATSLGGVESLIERRARYPLELAPEGLLRLSVGCEDVEDLWRDLDRALAS